MPFIKKNFNGYQLHYYTSPDPPQIYLMQNGVNVAYLSFHPDGEALRPNMVSSEGHIGLYFRLSQFSHVVDILREETPLTVSINTDMKLGWISTSETEPAGEEERV